MTTTLLLDQLRDDVNQAAWNEMDERFRGVVFGVARKFGLDEADAADVAQETMVQSLQDLRAGRYDRSRGRLSGWIIAIAHNRITDVQRRQKRGIRDMGEPAQPVAPGLDAISVAWKEALRDDVFRRAWERLQAESGQNPANIKAFELAVIRGVPPEAVAADCGISVDQVYVAKNRVAGKLRRIVEQMTKAYEDGL
ncbi:MAG: sigma-70 family RNA polymerase sigma factor [Phycisphaeraceae bacterium]|nr:sigma-70 family RNA polymerase sigma factor [Phycisphaeraceae bacterium]